MTRLLAGLAVVAVAAFPLAGPASADHVCVEVDKAGTFGPPLTIGPVCLPTGLSHQCRTTEIGLVPTVVIYLYTCAPR